MTYLLGQMTKFRPLRDAEGEGGAGGSGGEGGSGEGASGEGAEGGSQPDLSFLPEQFRSDDGPDIDGFKTFFEDMQAENAIYKERADLVPKDATGYEFEMPKELDFSDLDLGEGFNLEINTENEQMQGLLGQLGGIMHEYGMPKEAAGKMMGLLGRYEATAYAQGREQMKAEMAKLGSGAEARIAKIGRALETKLPQEMADAAKALTMSADGVRALEKLLAPPSTGFVDNPPPKSADADLADYYSNPSR